jgi:glucokinase
VVSKGVQPNAPRIFESAVNLLIKIYSAVIGNFIIHHMSVGGLYLVGSLTNSLIPKLKGVDILAGFKARHSVIASLVDKAAIIVCKDVDLGLKGAYFVARSILIDN